MIKRKNERIKYVVLTGILLAAMVLVNSNDSHLGSSSSRQKTSDTVEILTPAIPMAGLGSEEDVTLKAMADELFERTNAARRENGLPELVYSLQLEHDAQIRAREQEQLFSHQRPDGSDWWTVDPGVVYGENLAKFYPDAESVFNGFMNSKGHRENMLNRDYRVVGMGVYRTDSGSLYWAVLFGY